MGYYYDWVNEKWQHRPGPVLPERRYRRRETLLRYLLAEINDGDSLTSLYAGLLARALVVLDEELMNEYGERVAPPRRHADKPAKAA